MSSITVEGHPHGLYGGTPVAGTFASTGAVPQAVQDQIADSNWCVRIGATHQALKGGVWVEVVTAGIGNTGPAGLDSTVAGPQGDSAYIIYQNNGGLLSESDWLSSLEGSDSTVAGPQGDSAYVIYQNGGGLLSEADWLTSLQGNDGQSAYELAFANDNSIGTETVWLASLKGDTGDTAYDAYVNGGGALSEADWLLSQNGKDTYQLYLDNGGTDTVTDWLANMQGINGVGQSAYALAVQEGYAGTEPEWLETLKGNTAYQIWVNAGNSGTEADYIEFTRGKSAFELWSLNPANAGLTLNDYLATLRGADGSGFNIHDPHANYLEHDHCYKDGKFYVANTDIAGTTTVRPFVEGDGDQEWTLLFDAHPAGLWVTEIVQNNGTYIDVKRRTPVAGEDTEIILYETDATEVTVTLIGDRDKTRLEPTVTVNGIQATRAAGNSGVNSEFRWDVTIPVTEMITATSVGSGSVRVLNQPVPPALAPVISNVTIIDAPATTSLYPGIQTEVKQGDTFYISFESDIEISSIVVEGSGAGTAGTVPLTPGLVFTDIAVTCGYGATVASLENISIKGVAALTSVNWAISSNQINCNSLAPSITFGAPTYPAGQQAIKDTESANVVMTLADYDTVAYSSGQLTVTDNGTDIDCAYLTGDYNISVNNNTATAKRIANDTTTVVSDLVNIVNVPAQVVLSGLPNPMKSGGNHGTSPADYTVTKTCNQELLTRCSTTIPVGVLSAFTTPAQNVLVTTATVTIDDADVQGNYTFTAPTGGLGLSNIPITAWTAGDAYVIRGFINRNVLLAPFASTVTVAAPLAIGDESNVTIVWDFTPDAQTYSAVDADLVSQYTILNVTATTFDVKMLDAAVVAASSQPSNLLVGYS